jgi:S1-C subfamily serine protease
MIYYIMEDGENGLMMKKGLWFRLLMIVLMVLGLVSCCRGEGMRVKVVKNLVLDLQNSTVMIVGEGRQGWEVRCSGVWIDGSRFLTARHCVADNEELAKPGMLVRFKVRREINIKKMEVSLGEARWGLVRAVGREDDLALVSAIDGIGDGMGVELGVELGKVLVSDHVIVIGHTGGLPYNYLEGVVTGEREDMLVEGDKFLSVAVSGSNGNSGGGVFDKDGRLVGICSFLLRAAPGHVFFVHVDKIREFLNSEGIR